MTTHCALVIDGLAQRPTILFLAAAITVAAACTDLFGVAIVVAARPTHDGRRRPRPL